MTTSAATKTAQDELVEALLDEVSVEDASPKDKSLAEHDKEKHPDGFNPETDTCKFRERIATETEEDKADIEDPHKAPKVRTATSKTYGVPYQGSKSRIAARIALALPKGNRFVDLFSGGGAMTHAALESGKYKSYRMNDLDGVGQKLFIEGVSGKWDDYSRSGMTEEEFAAIKGTPEALPWSFNGLGRNLAKSVEGGRDKAAEQIRRVKSLSALKDHAGKIESSEKDYREVELQEGDVVYADIPYEDTDQRGYRKGMGFDKEAFCKWAEAQDVPVYVSEYTMPEGWTEVMSFPVAGMRGGERSEKLFVQDRFARSAKRQAFDNLMVADHPKVKAKQILEMLSQLGSKEEMEKAFATAIGEDGESTKTVQDELYESLVEDADTLNDQTLQEHDKRHHPQGYHEGDTCKFRDKMNEETPEDQADELPLGKGNWQSSRGNKSLDRFTELAKRIKGFIKGVKIRFSETPYQGEGNDVRKSIKESEQKHWNKILDAFENKTAGADATFHHQLLDHTPAVYQRLGVKNLPITIMGGVIHKMIGNIRNSEYDYHEIPISELRNLLIDLDNPVAVFDSKSDPDALVVLTNILDKHGNLKSVVPLKLERDASGTAKENVIASGYGQKPENLQSWIDEGYLRYVGKKALRKSAQRLQLPGDSILRDKGVLTENDFSSEQLGDIIPDSGAAVKGGDEKKEDVGEVINFRDSIGEVVGTYNRKTNEVVLYDGADADTIGHELCGHATWQYAEQQAKKGDRRLLDKMQEVVDAPAAKPVWDEVKANYEGEDREVQREEVWAHIIGHETSKAIEEIQKSRSGRRWYQKFWNVVKDAWKGLLSTVRINSVHLEGTEEMSPKEFSEYIVKQMIERKTLGRISKGEEGENRGERKSIVKKPLVSPEEDAAYMEAVERGDMETAQRMVREAAARAGYTIEAYHGTERNKKRQKDVFPFTVFDTGRRGKLATEAEDEPGSYFTPEFDYANGAGIYASWHGRKRGSIVGKFFLRDDVDVLERGGHREFRAKLPEQIKSADPVTYDDKGNVIPLSRRFNDGDDIRGDVAGNSSFIDMMKSLHPDVNPDELLAKLKSLGSREEMEREVAQILGAKKK